MTTKPLPAVGSRGSKAELFPMETGCSNNSNKVFRPFVFEMYSRTSGGVSIFGSSASPKAHYACTAHDEAKTSSQDV